MGNKPRTAGKITELIDGDTMDLRLKYCLVGGTVQGLFSELGAMQAEFRNPGQTFLAISVHELQLIDNFYLNDVLNVFIS